MEGNTCPVISPPAESPKPPDLASTGTNTGGASPKVDRDRESPEPNCAICLGKTENKSFTDSCLHQFCFNCLLEWSKVKAECPLCKQSFKSIIHNVRSNEDYDQYHLHLHAPTEPNFWPNVEANVVRVRYRTTLTAERQRERFLESIMTPYFMSTDAIPHERNVRRRHRMFTSDFRALVYRDNLWVNPLPDITGRYRECSPEFYRLNPAQVHRLAPWLNRELSVLSIPSTHIMVVMELIFNLLTRYHINSVEFRSHVSPHMGANTDHFIHEFYAFARSPYDMMGFDQSAEYRERMPYTYELQPIDSDSDSDVVVLSPRMGNTEIIPVRPPGPSQSFTLEIPASTASTSRGQGRSSPLPGPSGLGSSSANITWTVTSLPVASSTTEPPEPSTSVCVNVIDNQEEVVDSDSDDCVIVGYVKPRHERTPEIITLESEPEAIREDRASTDSYISDLMFSSSTSSDSSSNSDFTPYTRSSRKLVPKRKKVKKNLSSSSEGTIIISKRKLRLPSTDTDSTVTSHCRHKRKSPKSKGKKKRMPILPDTSDDDTSLDRAVAKRRKAQREVWRIVKKQEPENDHDYSRDCYDPPYTEEEVATFSSDSRPKLRSIVITKSASNGSQRECSYSSVASSSRSSSRHHESSKCHRHRSHKRNERKKKDRRRSESSSPVRPSKVRRKSRKAYSSSDSSS